MAFMANFMDAMNAVADANDVCVSGTKQLGENLSPEYTARGVQDGRVALFFALVRNLPDVRLEDLVKEAVAMGKDRGDTQVLADLVVMAFQTRNCRGGKGERDLFYKMFYLLSKELPKESVLALLELIPKYGYYKDYWRLLEFLQGHSSRITKQIKSRILDLVASQLQKDQEELVKAQAESRTPQISLLAKYAPRDNHHFAKGGNKETFKALLDTLFPKSKSQKADYRKMISGLTRALDVTEVKMCGGHYEEIAFSKVPSLCLKKWTKAFLNERVDKMPMAEEDLTGNRYKKDPKRIATRAHLREVALSKEGLHGSVVFPHEITREFMEDKIHKVSPLQRDVLCAQWRNLRESVVEALKDKKPVEGGEEATTTTIDLGKLVPLVDVSGSMAGTPMEVAIALGILVSELTHPAFRDRFLTFSESPAWVDLSRATNLADKVTTTQEAPWGGSTNFVAALELILEACVKAKLRQDEIPALIVFSDMQFDQAHRDGRRWETQYERIVRRFQEEGTKACGQPWQAPEIIFWNLRGDTFGFPAQADTLGVQMLSGFSPALLKAVLNGEPLPEETKTEMVEQEDGTMMAVTTKGRITPYATLRKVLDDECYDAVRVVLAANARGPLTGYKFVPKEKEVEGNTTTAEDDAMVVDTEDGWSEVNVAGGKK